MTQATHFQLSAPRFRPGFTLVEVLVVIGIISILVGLLLPTVSYAYKSTKQRSIVMEVHALASAVEKYRQKYDDYPPDGADLAIFQRHCLKVFPHMVASELADLRFAVKNNQGPYIWPNSLGPDTRVMDPTEALVFFLGGFSDDPVHPFTGPGGPIQILSRDNQGSATAAQYNVDRNAPLYDFKQSQLTLDTSSGVVMSNDEVLYGLHMRIVWVDANVLNDALPAYRLHGLESPIVYFDSRTYSVRGYLNHFSPGTRFSPNHPDDPGVADVKGFARPYKSTQIDTTITNSIATRDRYYRYMNEKTFQIICAGRDDDFGGLNPLTYGQTLFSVFPTGQQLDISKSPAAQRGPTGYQDEPGQPSAQLDNATNFCDGVLASAL